MKKALIGIGISIGLFASIFAYTGSNVVNAQTIDVSQFRQIIELFIALGIISPDKADQVRFAFGISTSTPPVVSTTTPIFSGVSSPVSNTLVGSVSQTNMTLASISETTRGNAMGNGKYDSDPNGRFWVLHLDMGTASKALFSYDDGQSSIETSVNQLISNTSSDVGRKYTITSYDKDGNVLGTTTGVIQ